MTTLVVKTRHREEYISLNRTPLPDDDAISIIHLGCRFRKIAASLNVPALHSAAQTPRNDEGFLLLSAMARDKDLYVYILTNKHHTVLYTGVTSDLVNRVWQHKNKQIKGFTKRYNMDKLVFFEGPGDPIHAIEREKQIKAGSRQKKIDLINEMNPDWKDLYYEIIPKNYK